MRGGAGVPVKLRTTPGGDEEIVALLPSPRDPTLFRGTITTKLGGFDLATVTRRDPQYAEALQILGDDYTRRDRFQDGLRIDQRLALLRPRDALVHYNLACSYSLTQQCDLAAEALNTALNLGYHDFKWMAEDPDLKNLREHAGYKKIAARVRGRFVKET